MLEVHIVGSGALNSYGDCSCSCTSYLVLSLPRLRICNLVGSRQDQFSPCRVLPLLPPSFSSSPSSDLSFFLCSRLSSIVSCTGRVLFFASLLAEFRFKHHRWERLGTRPSEPLLDTAFTYCNINRGIIDEPLFLIPIKLLILEQTVAYLYFVGIRRSPGLRTP